MVYMEMTMVLLGIITVFKEITIELKALQMESMEAKMVFTEIKMELKATIMRLVENTIIYLEIVTTFMVITMKFQDSQILLMDPIMRSMGAKIQLVEVITKLRVI